MKQIWIAKSRLECFSRRMNEPKHIARQDRPITLANQDQLDRSPFVASLVRALVHDELNAVGELEGRVSTGFVVGLTGHWGLGKSSVLNLLALQLGSMDHVIVATLNPWLFKGRDELIAAFFSELRDAIGRSNTERVRELREFVDRYWVAIDLAAHAAAKVAAFHGIPIIGTAWAWVSEKLKGVVKPTDRSPLEERRALEKKLKASKTAVVVLIDELDRVEDDDVRAVAQLIKAVGDIKGISYLVAYDPERVADALGRGGSTAERRSSGEHYLEKIIQYPVPLRPLLTEDVRGLLDATLASHDAALEAPRSERETGIINHLHEAISTPREVKRLIGAYTVLEAAVHGEVSPYDVLAYSWLLTKTPSLRDAIARDPDKVVDDPAEKEMVERIVGQRDERDRRPSPADVLGEQAKQHAELLKLLFPRFAEDRNRNDPDGTSIARRRNLIRLLYLGNPPGMVSRAELEQLWTIADPDQMEAALRTLNLKNGLASALDRLDDLLPELPEGGDAIFWPALSRVLVRDADWVQGVSNEYRVADDAATVLFHLGTRLATNAPRVKRVVEALISAGDLLLVPDLLRKHLFAHGLTKHGSARGGKTIYTSDETIALLEREAPRYRTAIVDGTALRRLTNVEAMYVLGNRNLWDDELRTAFTAQLKGRDAIATLATLLVPPGHGGERSSFNQLFDADEVQKEIGALGPLAEWERDPWVIESVRRLHLILRNRDPNFDNDDDLAPEGA